MLELWRTCYAAEVTDLDINVLISSKDLHLAQNYCLLVTSYFLSFFSVNFFDFFFSPLLITSYTIS